MVIPPGSAPWSKDIRSYRDPHHLYTITQAFSQMLRIPLPQQELISASLPSPWLQGRIFARGPNSSMMYP